MRRSALMMYSGAALSSVAVVPRNNSAESLFPLNLALVRGLEIWAKNLIPDKAHEEAAHSRAASTSCALVKNWSFSNGTTAFTRKNI